MPRPGRLRVDWGTFWGAIWFLVIGGGFAGFGSYQLVTTYQFLPGAAEVMAEVVENPESCDDDGGCTWWPRFRLIAADGAEVHTKTRFGASNFGYGEGTKVRVLYNPDYTYVRIPGRDNLWLLGGAFFVLGMLPVVIAFWLLLSMTFYREEKGD
ncbi:MAG: DUF3592 domain-containing protein [Brevirhabdus sp.]